MILLANSSFRGAAKAFQILLGLGGALLGAPTANCGRLWLMRLGLYELQRPLPHAGDWVWIVDHTVQIGSQRCLVIVGVQPSELDGHLSPELSDLSVIAIEPVERSNADVIQQQLSDAIQRTGVPRLIVSDGCRELKKGIAQFIQAHPAADTVYDIKHKAALILKKALEADGSWREFNQAVNKARQATSPTRWAHLIPPAIKTKARYMNMGPLIRWAQNMVDYMQAPFSPNPDEPCEAGPINIHYKWILNHREDIAEWLCQIRVLDTVMEYCRRHGYHQDMVARLRPTLDAIAQGRRSQDTANMILAFLQEQSAIAKEGEALLATSESIESLFSKGKHLQRQQSASGFTSLVLGFAAIVVRKTETAIREAFAAVKTDDVLKWSAQKIGMTVQARRRNTLGKTAAEQKRRKPPLPYAA